MAGTTPLLEDQLSVGRIKPLSSVSTHRPEASLTYFKLGAAALTFLIAIVGINVPWALRRMPRLLSLANMLSAGVMLGGGLLHLLPDANDELPSTDYPFAQLGFSLGLLLPLAVETLLAPALPTSMHTKNDPQSFRDLYKMAVNNPNNYSMPRMARLGITLDF